ncbi:MAG: hypothetical protein SGILL_009057 [Bacillariaceae sp.]
MERHKHDPGILGELTQQMQALSVEEQERAMYDLMTENELTLKMEGKQTPQQWMDQMDAAMEHKRRTTGGTILQKAMHMNLQFVKDQRWKFLRAEDWNVQRAVDRMGRFFEHKLDLFGEEALCRELTMQDLTPEDKEYWRETGFLQILDERDRTGRPVVIMFGKAQMNVPLDTVIRVCFYLCTISVNEERVQIGGVAQGYWAIGQAFTRPDRATAVLRSWRCLPVRTASKHFCYDNDKIKLLFGLMAQHWNPLQASRFRAHYGTPMECIYNLMTYGVSRESIPVRDDGTLLLEYHRSFLEALEAREKAERLLLALGDGNQIKEDQPFLPLETQNDLLETMWMETDGDDGMAPLPLDYEIEDILPDDVVQRLARSSVSTQEPLPMNTSITNLDGLPTSFLSRLARSSFVRSGTSTGGSASFTMQTSRPSNNGVPAIAPSVDSHKPKLPVIRTTSLIVVPGPLDVILGRGRHNKNKPGNRMLQDKLDGQYDKYEAADKYQKTALAEAILDEMKAQGSRFLVRQGEKKHAVWVEVTHEKARDKISHDFRNMRGTSGKKKAGATQNDTGGKGKRPRSLTGGQSQPSKRPFGF